MTADEFNALSDRDKAMCAQIMFGGPPYWPLGSLGGEVDMLLDEFEDVIRRFEMEKDAKDRMRTLIDRLRAKHDEVAPMTPPKRLTK